MADYFRIFNISAGWWPRFFRILWAELCKVKRGALVGSTKFCLSLLLHKACYWWRRDLAIHFLFPFHCCTSKKIPEKFLSMTKICKTAANTEPFLFLVNCVCVSMAASLYPNQYLSHWHASLAWIAGHIQCVVYRHHTSAKNVKVPSIKTWWFG